MQDPSAVRDALIALGVDPSIVDCANGSGPIRVVVVQAGLDEARRALSDIPRDQVIMARVDKKTALDLDRWVDIGIAKSRSEAAALFMREGMNLRQSDLDRLSNALQDVAEAKARLRTEAEALIGTISLPSLGS